MLLNLHLFRALRAAFVASLAPLAAGAQAPCAPGLADTLAAASTAYRPGAPDTAAVRFRHADSLCPSSVAPDRDRPSLAPRRRRASLQIVARTRGDRFETRGSQGWTPFYVQGVNLGVALPGRFPSEFPVDSALYAGWLDTIAGMRANAVRVYTILPPAFYRALGGWNRTHPTRALWLVHGVWT
jgi:hypothetical protein